MNTSELVSAESSELIRTTLLSLLEGNQSTLKLVADREYPLVIVSTFSDVAGFALVDEHAHECYETAYGVFKEQYRENHDRWADRNLSFVVCRAGTTPSEDAFFNQIAADVYFCPKYVVRFFDQVEALKQELELLPFIPLPKGTHGGIVRPPSAQTLLRQMGASAILSRRIVRPHEYSVSRFIQDCLENIIELPSEIVGEVKLQDRPAADLPCIARLRSLEIESFRAYKQKQTFNLDADIVVLYGPNGLGKTSFFDAIDFVCTGRIGRFHTGHRLAASDLHHLMCNLDAKADQAIVALDIEKDSKQSRVVRRVVQWDNAFIDDQHADRKAVLCFLSSPDWSEETPRIDVIERLFRASHLFSQSEQEFFEKFPTHSIIPSELVSRMLALDDYASAISKVDDIMVALSRKIAEKKADAAERKEKISALLLEIGRLQPSENKQVPTASVMQVASQVRSSLKKQRPDTDFQKDLSTDTARDWRSLIVADLESAKSRLSSLRHMLPLAKEQIKAQAEGTRLRQRELEAQKDTDEKIALLKGLQQQVQAAIANCQNQESRMLAASKDVDNHNRHLECLAQERTLSDSEQSAMKKTSTLRDLAKKADKEEEDMRIVLDQISSRKAQTENKIVAAKETCRLWTELAEGLRKHGPAHGELQALRDKFHRTRDALRVAKEAHSRGIQHLSTLQHQFADLDQFYRRATADEQDLVRLLDQIESHVKDGICPTCGSTHPTKEDLIEKIRARKSQRPMEVHDIAAKRTEVKNRIERQGEENAALETRACQLQEEEKTISAEIISVEEAWARVAAAAAQAGLDLGRSDAVIFSEANKETSARLVLALAATLKTLDSELLTTRQRAERNAATKKDLLSQMTRDEKELRELRSQLSAVRARRATTGLPIEWDEATTRKHYEEKIVAAAQTKRKYEDANRHKTDLERAVLLQEAAITAAKMLMKDIREKTREIDDARSRLDGKFVAVGLQSSATADDVQHEVVSVAEELASLEVLLGQIHFLEVALDANSRTTQISQLQTIRGRLEAEAKDISDIINRLEQNQRIFLSVLHRLKMQQDRAVKSHIEGYGPLTSVIQQRLRSVYGFGPVRLSAQASEIAIEVQRDGTFEKRSNYFSDSQQRTPHAKLIFSWSPHANMVRLRPFLWMTQ